MKGRIYIIINDVNELEEWKEGSMEQNIGKGEARGRSRDWTWWDQSPLQTSL
jgi:hypothetical protein